VTLTGEEKNKGYHGISQMSISGRRYQCKRLS
jgi:hypothetical protein